LHHIHLPQQGNLLINESITVEIGKKNKLKKQIEEITNAYIGKRSN
jgi:hypothetical protein